MDVFDIARAIARAEGYYVLGSLPARTNNPGDLELGDAGHGVVSGKTVFGSPASGWSRLILQIGAMLSGSEKWPPTMTLAEAGMKYSGGDPMWAANVAKELTLLPGTTLAQIKAMVNA